jgi:hypothetical protein
LLYRDYFNLPRLLGGVAGKNRLHTVIKQLLFPPVQGLDNPVGIGSIGKDVP